VAPRGIRSLRPAPQAATFGVPEQPPGVLATLVESSSPQGRARPLCEDSSCSYRCPSKLGPPEFCPRPGNTAGPRTLYRPNSVPQCPRGQPTGPPQPLDSPSPARPIRISLTVGSAPCLVSIFPLNWRGLLHASFLGLVVAVILPCPPPAKHKSWFDNPSAKLFNGFLLKGPATRPAGGTRVTFRGGFPPARFVTLPASSSPPALSAGPPNGTGLIPSRSRGFGPVGWADRRKSPDQTAPRTVPCIPVKQPSKPGPRSLPLPSVRANVNNCPMPPIGAANYFVPSSHRRRGARTPGQNPP